MPCYLLGRLDHRLGVSKRLLRLVLDFGGCVQVVVVGLAFHAAPSSSHQRSLLAFCPRPFDLRDQLLSLLLVFRLFLLADPNTQTKQPHVTQRLPQRAHETPPDLNVARTASYCALTALSLMSLFSVVNPCFSSLMRATFASQPASAWQTNPQTKTQNTRF